MLTGPKKTVDWRKYSYFNIPYIMLDEEEFPGLSFDAIALYGYLLDYVGLSILHKEKFSLPTGEIYIRCQVPRMMDALHLKRSTAYNRLAELESYGLIVRFSGGGAEEEEEAKDVDCKNIMVTDFQSRLEQEAGGTFLPFTSEKNSERYASVRVPLQMLSLPAFSDLSLQEVGLYCMLLNRLGLSEGDLRFTDEDGNRFCLYTIDEIMRKMRIGKNKAISLLAKLEETGLIEKKPVPAHKKKAGKAYTRIYIYDFEEVARERMNKTRRVKKSAVGLLAYQYIKTETGGKTRWIAKKQEVRKPALRKIGASKGAARAADLQVKNGNVDTENRWNFNDSKIETISVQKSNHLNPENKPSQSRNQTICFQELNHLSPESKPTVSTNQTITVQKINPKYLNKNTLRNTGKNYLKKSPHIQSLQRNRYRVIGRDRNDVPFNWDPFRESESFETRFALAIELKALTSLGYPEELSDLTLKEKQEFEVGAKSRKELYRLICEEMHQVREKGEAVINGRTISARTLETELLSMDSMEFEEIYHSIWNNPKPIRQYGRYAVAVFYNNRMTKHLKLQNLSNAIRRMQDGQRM